MTQLTYREASALVQRAPRTLRHWRQNGMPMGWEIRQGQKVRVVAQDVLQAWFRDRLMNDPVHQQRMRTLALQDARDTPSEISS